MHGTMNIKFTFCLSTFSINNLPTGTILHCGLSGMIQIRNFAEYEKILKVMLIRQAVLLAAGTFISKGGCCHTDKAYVLIQGDQKVSVHLTITIPIQLMI